jgi:ubiquinone/menaquinone biosynthesis C-methylase UbiE
MLKTARPKLARCSDLRWQTIVTEHRRMPLLDGCADVSLAGWTLGYFNSRYCGAVWKQALQQALGEMRRVLRPGGTIIIIETLGTGATEPTPPHEDLAAYYHWLEDELGFQSKWIRTDYQFDSLDQSAELTGFFFGEEWAEKVRRNNWIILPECTGIWWKNVG